MTVLECELDQTFSALANEVRRDIVGQLSTAPADTPALGQHFSITKQALHRHLAVLEDAGLVTRVRRGRTDRIELRPAALGGLTDWVASVRTAWEANLDRLAAVVERPDDWQPSTQPTPDRRESGDQS